MRKPSVLEQLQMHVLQNNTILHGSPKFFNEVHPHAADGEIAVCCTTHPAIAIFMGLFGPCKKDPQEKLLQGYTLYNKGKKLFVHFKLEEENHSKLLSNEKLNGHIHLLDPHGFKKYNDGEYRTYESRYVINSISISKKDLPFLPIEGQCNYSVVLNKGLINHFK